MRHAHLQAVSHIRRACCSKSSNTASMAGTLQGPKLAETALLPSSSAAHHLRNITHMKTACLAALHEARTTETHCCHAGRSKHTMPLPGDQRMHVKASARAATACSGNGLPSAALSCAACSNPCMPPTPCSSSCVPAPVIHATARCCMHYPAPSKSCPLSSPSELLPGNTTRRQHAALPSDCAACTCINLQGEIRTALHVQLSCTCTGSRPHTAMAAMLLDRRSSYMLRLSGATLSRSRL